MKFKLDLVKLAGIGAAALGIAGSLISNWAGQKKMDETIKKEVEKALTSKK